MTPRLCAALKSKLAAHEAGPATLSVPQTTIWVVKDTLRTALGLEFASERPLILKSVTIPSPAYLAGAGAFESRVLRAVNGTVVNTVTDLRRAIESAQIIQLSFTSQSYCRTTEPSGQAGDNLFHNSPPCNPQPAETPPRELFTQECAGITEQQRLISGPVASGRPESLPGEYRRDTSLPAVCSELGEPACKSPTGWCAGRTSCVPSLEERAKRFADLVAGPPPPEFCDVRPPSRLSQPASDPGRDPAPRSASNVGECPPALEARLERHEASDRSRIADSECAAWIALVGDIVSRARAAPFSFSRGAARRLPTFVTPAAFAENPPSCPDNLPVFNNARPVYNPRPQFVTPASFRDSPDLPPASLPPSQPPSPRQWVRVQAENGIEGVQWVKR
ncbi:hypothetical protein DIPPA_34447 [Diplonema papillatum]|nr:hypothetical protein DIPPA_34447 [Diplonema papillatum]